jgi:hypothetical protein
MPSRQAQRQRQRPLAQAQAKDQVQTQARILTLQQTSVETLEQKTGNSTAEDVAVETVLGQKESQEIVKSLVHTAVRPQLPELVQMLMCYRSPQ